MDYSKDMANRITSLIGDSQVNLNNSDPVESDQREVMRHPGCWGRVEKTSSGDPIFRPNPNQYVTMEDYRKRAEAIARIPVQVDENLPPEDVPEALAILEESKSLAIERETGGWWTCIQGRVQQFPPDLGGYSSEKIIAKAGESDLMHSHMETKAKGGHKPKTMPFTHATMGLDTYDIGRRLVEESKFQLPDQDDPPASRGNWQGNWNLGNGRGRQPMSRVEAVPNIQQKGRKGPSPFDCQYGASNRSTQPDQLNQKAGGSNGLGGGSNFNHRNGKSDRWTSSGDENFPTRSRPENGNGTKGFSRSHPKKRRPNWAKKFFEGIQRAIDEGNQDFVPGPVHPCQVKNGNEPEKKSQVHYFSENSSSGSAPGCNYEGSSSDEEPSEPDVSSSAPTSSEETVVHNSSEAISSSSFAFQNEVEESNKSEPDFQEAPVNEVKEVSDTPAPEPIFDSHVDQEDLSAQTSVRDPHVDSVGNAVDQVNTDPVKSQLVEHASVCKATDIQDPISELKIDQIRNMRHSGQLSPELVQFASDIVDKCLEEGRQRVAAIIQQHQYISNVDEKESAVVDSELLINSDKSTADHLVDKENGIGDSIESGKAISVADDDSSSTVATENTETADKSEVRSSSSESENQGRQESGDSAGFSCAAIDESHVENTKEDIESMEPMAGTKIDVETPKVLEILHAQESVKCQEENLEMLQQSSEMLQQSSEMLQQNSKMLQQNSEMMQEKSEMLQQNSKMLQEKSEPAGANIAAPASDMPQKSEPMDIATPSSDLPQKSEPMDKNVAAPTSNLRQQDDPGHESCTDATVTSQAQSCEVGPETKTDESILEHTKTVKPAYVAEEARSPPFDSVCSIPSGEAPGPLPTISVPDVQTAAVEGLGHAQLVDTVNPSDNEAAALPTLAATDTTEILPTDETNVPPSLQQKESPVEEGVQQVKEVEAATSSSAKSDAKKPKACLQQ